MADWYERIKRGAEALTAMDPLTLSAVLASKGLSDKDRRRSLIETLRLMKDLAPGPGEAMIGSVYGPISKLQPATWKAMGEASLSGLGSKMLNTLLNRGEEAAGWRELAGAAEDTGASLAASHVTNDPSKVVNRLKSGLPIKEGRREGKFGELGTGLYGSASPQMWMGRATGKWDFLKSMQKDQLSALTDYLQNRVNSLPKGYITASEREFGERLIREAKQTGYAESLTMLADQPFNINDFWKPDILKDLKIKPGLQPTIAKMEAKGRFIELDKFPSQEEAMRLNKLGFNGAWMKSGFSSTPQLVVWDNSGVAQFADYKKP